MNIKFDVIVIGSGPAGQKAAIASSKAGKKVAVIEKKEVVGGICLHTGTIPSKTLREAALYLSGVTLKHLYGQHYRVKDKITIQDLLYRTNHVIDSELNVILEHFRRYNIEVFQGIASFSDEHTLSVETREESLELQADKFIIATGTQAYRPDDYPFNNKTVIDSDQILEIKELPKHLVIVGAGVIGIEYASIFSILDVDVTVISRSSELFGFIDKEITDKLTYHLRENKVNLLMDEMISNFSLDDNDMPDILLESGKRLKPDLVMVASGRSGTGVRLNLEAASVKVNDRGLLIVNENFQTEQSHIYGAGDIIGFPSLASTSMEQGRKAAMHACDMKMKANIGHFPYGIYSIPEISYVGKNEEELSNSKIPYISGLAFYKEIAKGEILEDYNGFLKMLFHQETKALLGVHIIGTGATELIHIGQAVINFEGTLDYFLDAVFNYPTLAECYKIAALNADTKFRKIV